MAFYAEVFPDFSQERVRRLGGVLDLDWTARAGELSRGGRAQVKLAATLSRAAPVVALDEPFSGLDPLVCEAVLTAVVSVVELDRQTVIVSTHEVQEVEPLLDLAVLLDRGRCRAVQPVDELLTPDGPGGLVAWMRHILSQAAS